MLGRRICCASRFPPFLHPTTSTTAPCPPVRNFRSTVSSPPPLSLGIKSNPASLFLPRSRVSSLLHSSMSLRRSKSSTRANGEANGHTKLTNGSGIHHDEPKHNDHSHSHSIFHSHGEEGHGHGHEKIMEALQGGGRRYLIQSSPNQC